MLEHSRNLATRYRYELVALINGAVIMVLELVGARAIAPYMGSSIYVWTAVIGVILGAMSFGYWYGGRMADRVASDRVLAVIMFMAAVVLLVSLVFREAILSTVAGYQMDLRLRAFLASLLLFAPANVLMGMVAPYLAKLKVTDLHETGRSVGGLYAAGTVGSILGTFAAGYWLIAYFGNRWLGLMLVIVLIGASLILSRHLLGRSLAVALVAGLLMAWPGFGQTARPGQEVLYDGDSAYQRIQVVDVGDGSAMLRMLVTDERSAESGILLHSPSTPAFDYIRNFMEVAEASGGPKRVLMIGGGTLTLPMLLRERYPGVRIDVVEIDPKLDELAERFFRYQPSENVRVFHQDGRVFLNQNRERYDAIFVDAFSATTPPFQLTTLEAVKRIQAALAPEGLAVVNVVSAFRGADGRFLEAEYATYAKVFAAQAVVPARGGVPGEVLQNFILVAANQPARHQAVMTAWGATPAARPAAGQVLVDEFAPVEQLTAWKN